MAAIFVFRSTRGYDQVCSRNIRLARLVDPRLEQENLTISTHSQIYLFFREPTHGGVRAESPKHVSWAPSYFFSPLLCPLLISVRPQNGRDELESLMCSLNPKDWIKLCEMLLGPVPKDFDFEPKVRGVQKALLSRYSSTR